MPTPMMNFNFKVMNCFIARADICQGCYLSRRYIILKLTTGE
jgi:hypothetical protein